MKSYGRDKVDCPEAVDILAVWIAEDVVAFAKSFGVEPTAVLEEAIQRIQSESLLRQGDSDAGHSGSETGGKHLGR